MNIFYLDSDPAEATKQICNVHVNKMIIESCQMLSTAHHVLDGDKAPDGIMKLTHKNHPSSIWVRQNKNHYQWLYLYTVELCNLYTERTGKIHKCESQRLQYLIHFPKNLPSGMFTPPPACMPDDFKHKSSVVKSYRAYLNTKYKEWLSRERPLKVEFQFGKPKWLTV